jgi:ABC-type transport system substrate-binding protein
MMNVKKLRGRAVVTTCVLGMLLLGTSPAVFSASATLTSPTQQERTRHFSETNLDVSGAFLDVWESGRSFEDSLSVNGLPLTTRHEEISLSDGKAYQVQWFERARFEMHPENGTTNGVLLGVLGVFTAEGRRDQPFKVVPDPGGSVQWFSQTKHTLGDASDGGQAIARFWLQKGGLAQFGYPLSQPFQEVTREADPRVAGKSFLVQYFERQRIEYHPENKGTPYEMLLGRLGSEQKNLVPVREATLQRGNDSVDVLRLDFCCKQATLMPLLEGGSAENAIYGAAIFNSLVKRHGSGNLVPDLAEYVPTIENGGAYFAGTGDDKRLLVKYKLKRGIKWYDGQPLNSSDVMFTYKLLINPDFPGGGPQIIPKIAGMDNPDPYTIILSYRTWKEAASLIAQDKAIYGTLRAFVDRKIPVTDPQYNHSVDFYILPEHALSKIAPADILSSEYARLPWGSGPYHVTKFDPGVDLGIEAEINPNYNVTSNKPLIKRLVTPPLAQSYGLDISKLDAETADVIVSSVSPENLPTGRALVSAGKFKLVPALHSALGWEHVDFNVQREPFNDKRLRQAVAYALDRDAIIRSILGIQVPVPNSWIMASNWASIDNPANAAKYPGIVSQLQKYPYDPAKANQLLDQAGWTQRDANGTRVKNNGKLKIRWLIGQVAFRLQIAKLAQQQLKAVGIEVTIDARKGQEFFAGPPDGLLPSGSFGDYGVAEFAWTGWGDEPGGIALYDSTQIPSDANSFKGLNYTRWANAESDRLLREADLGLGHSPERLKAFLQQQVIIMQDLPSIPMSGILNGIGALIPARLQHFEANSDTTIGNIQNWYLPKR